MARSWRGVAAEIERASAPSGPRPRRLAVVEGTRLHERALRAGLSVPETLVAAEALRAPDERLARLLAELDRAGSLVLPVPAAELARRTGGRGTGPLLGLVVVPPATALAPLVSAAPDAVFLVCAGVEDPGNTGALVRSALAAGAAGLVVAGAGDPWHPRAIRTSMGSVFKLPLLWRDDLGAWCGELRALGGRTLAAVTEGGAPPRAACADRGAPLAFAVGGEAHGLSSDARGACDGTVTIPMAAGVDSFSVSAAAAVLLYEARVSRPT